MVESRANSESFSWQALLGYLNFSEGRTDARFQGQLNEAFRLVAERAAAEPVPALAEMLRFQLVSLSAGGSSAFQQVQQVEAVLSLVFTRLLPAYRQHHADLLAHLSDRDLFQPFFLARAFEAVLAQGPPWTEQERIVTGALARLNDFVGHRPIAVLESRRRGEPYDHERVRPVPLYIRGAGVAWGRYHDLAARAVEILAGTDPAIRAEARFDPKLLDELAFDPRGYDHGHPANRRMNYLFGEWDPHHMDNQGRFRRFVVRRLVLEALMDRIDHPQDLARDEVLQEAATVLAGIVLMAAGISGGSATTHDSSVTLAVLQKRIAAYRDAFYAQALKSVGGVHGERLRQEATQMRQPFGAARQHLNQFLTQHRAAQQQERYLSLLFAEMGYPEASRQHAARVQTPSVRLLDEIVIRLTLGQLQSERGELAAAAALLPEAEDLLRRGIHCGAFADPWNILGFQGLFPVFSAREDSVRDPRIDDLIDVVERLFDLYARLLGEAAAAGDAEQGKSLLTGMRQLAQWWDQFASVTVSDVRRVHGGEAADAAEHVATALARWHEQGEATAGLAFWRQHLQALQAPKAFALVVDALLRKQDYRAAMALLMSWLSQAEQVPLEDGDFSFHALTLRWMLAVIGTPPQDAGPLVKKFFDYLEPNAEENWDVPRLENGGPEDEMGDDEEEEDPYRAAYEGVTYEDSTNDGQEGAVIEDAPVGKEFELESEARRLERRLRFLSTVARLWEMAARHVIRASTDAEALAAWLARARHNRQRLMVLLEAIHECPIPQPLGTHESLVEYDRRRVLKEQLLEAAIGTCLDTTLAVRALEGAGEHGTANASQPEWEPALIRLEQALMRGDAPAVRRELPAFLQQFQPEPLTFVPLSAGGHPAAILRARVAQTVLQTLVEQLPRLGLLRETSQLLRTARAMETVLPAQGVPVTEYDRIFQLGFQGVVESIVESARTWDTTAATDRALAELLGSVTNPFLRLWIDYTRSVQLSALETPAGPEQSEEPEWEKLRDFIQRYGRELFTADFLNLANVRGVLHRGVEHYLDYLQGHPDPLHPVRLLDDLGRSVPHALAVKCMKRVLRAVAENYEAYRDYINTTVQAAYGENLHVLLDFLRLKAGYDRHAWQFRPLVLVHEVLARGERGGAAFLLQEQFTAMTQNLADQHLQELARLEQAHQLRLRTVADHLQERFVKPLALDRLCVLVAPAMEEARRPGIGRSLARFREELRVHAATPTGAGLDVPHWLRRLQREVQRVRAERTAIAGLTRKHFLVPRVALALAEVQQQLAEWETPLLEERKAE